MIEKLFQNCEFIMGVPSLDFLPDATLSEIAFAGRSNVGKSSLINALTERKNLARTSNTPGRTQELNFFKLGDEQTGQIFMVDMPGYGYAKVSKSKRKAWDGLIRAYLRGRVSLRCVFVLVDGRHGLKDSDRELMKMLDEAGAPYRIVLTKTDKPKREELEKLIASITEELKKHPAAFPTPILTSAHKDFGLDDLRNVICGFV